MSPAPSGGVAIPIRCQKCGHEWATRSTRVRVVCPSCLASVRVPLPKIRVLARAVPLETFCDRCGADYSALSVCRTELGDPLLLCDRCAADLEPPSPSA